jgi:hypothetical protein
LILTINDIQHSANLEDERITGVFKIIKDAGYGGKTMALGDIWTDITSGEKLETLTLVTEAFLTSCNTYKRYIFFVIGYHWIKKAKAGHQVCNNPETAKMDDGSFSTLNCKSA